MRSQQRTISILFIVGLLGLSLTQPALRGQERDDSVSYTTWTARVKIKEVDRFILSPEVVTDKDGSIRLVHSMLLADETGATDYRQTEKLSERIHAKKVFPLDDIDMDSAELFFFGTAKQVRINGHPLKVEPLVSTGWKRARVSSAFLKTGANEVVFAGGGSLLIEPSRPGNSFRSDDGGETWSNRALAGDKHLRGEYLVRLRLPRYAPRGWAM